MKHLDWKCLSELTVISTVQQHNVCVCLCTRTDDRHALAVRVEVKQCQHFVSLLLLHLLDGDGVLRTRQKHEAEVPGCRHQGALIRRCRLVRQLN